MILLLVTPYLLLLLALLGVMWRMATLDTRLLENDMGRILGHTMLAWTPHAEIRFRRERRRLYWLMTALLTALIGYAVLVLLVWEVPR